MKTEQTKKWAVDDVHAGRLVCKPNGPRDDNDLWFCKWCYKIGWLGFESSDRRYVLIAMADGLVHLPKTKHEIAEWLNKEGMIPMREEWFERFGQMIPLTLGLAPASSPHCAK